MHLGAVLVLDPSIDVDVSDPDSASGLSPRVVAVLRQRVGKVPRLRGRLSSNRWGSGGAEWVEDLDFDPAAHVHHSRLPTPGGREELAARVGELLALPLAPGRPQWELHVLGDLAGGGAAVVAKLHHALGDGLRAVGLGLELFDPLEDLDPPPRPGLRPGLRVVPAPASTQRAGVGLPERVAGALSGAVSGMAAPVGRLLNPGIRWGEVTQRAGDARESAEIAAAVAHRMVLRPAPPSPLHVRSGPHRRFAMLRLDLDDLHRVRKTHGGTVNDVILAVVAGGLRRWLLLRNHTPTAALRALVPVSRTRRGGGEVAGNWLSGYLVDLPVHEPDPLARLQAVRQAMTANKAAGPTRGPGAFPLLADRLPALVHRWSAPLAAPLAAPAASRLFNTLVTLVPLPELPLRLAGARLREIYPVAPLAPGQGLGVAVSTFGATAHVGLHGDRAAMPDLDQVALALDDALAELLTC